MDGSLGILRQGFEDAFQGLCKEIKSLHNRNDTLQQHLDTIEKQNTKLEGKLAAVQKQNANLQGQLAVLHEQNASLDHFSGDTRPSSSRSTILPDPDRFEGQPRKYELWLVLMRGKLSVDGEAMGDNKARFYYVFFNLMPVVQDIALPVVSRAEELGEWDPEDLFAHLSRVYNDDVKVAHAEGYLFGITMKPNEPIHAYIARFQSLLFNARAQPWDEARKISAFQKGLRPAMRDHLLKRPQQPATYSEYIVMALEHLRNFEVKQLSKKAKRRLEKAQAREIPLPFPAAISSAPSAPTPPSSASSSSVSAPTSVPTTTPAPARYIAPHRRNQNNTDLESSTKGTSY